MRVQTGQLSGCYGVLDSHDVVHKSVTDQERTCKPDCFKEHSRHVKAAERKQDGNFLYYASDCY
ncbi:UNVERIFIED_CONTAM: hypothetical protein FKN15_057410 [Acipenser sinensis]